MPLRGLRRLGKGAGVSKLDANADLAASPPAHEGRLDVKGLAIGAAAALVAVGVRALLPLTPIQLPTLTVVIAVALTSTFRGTAAGLTAAAVGGAISWYLYFLPREGGSSLSGLIPLFGFAVISSAIVATSHLYRLSERRNQETRLAAVRKQAETAELFARELAHRLKNTLAIVQSIASQTLGADREETAKFAARLKTLAEAQDLLSEHIDRPTARVADVARRALAPFEGSGQRVALQAPDTAISAQEALSLALAVHELATNAAVHGALSTPGGRVALDLEEVGDRIRLRWREEGGPAVAPPASAGFGTALLRRLGTGAELVFPPEGARCSLYFRRP